MASKRRDATDSDDEAAEFAKQQAAVHLDVIKVLQQPVPDDKVRDQKPPSRPLTCTP